MANVFARLLAISTLITGIFWFLKRFKRARTAQPLQGMPAAIGDDAAVKTGHKLKWIEIFASLFPVFLLVFFVRSFIFEPFQIPSGSMMPTLLVGDFILVEKFAYDIKDPLTQTTLFKTGHPKRGDVVVFKYPPEPSMNYIKRVVGLPGDRVMYDTINKLVTVQAGVGCTIALPVTYREYREVTLSDCVQMVEHQESLGSMPHNILTVPGQKDQLGMYYKQPGNSLAEWVVPQGKYFMMGDNRDNSADSRYWGFVPERNLIGKATVIWMSFDKQEGKWPTGVRLSRIGRIH